MTERITPTEVRKLAEKMDYTRPENVDVHTLSGWVHKILAIAAQMKHDYERFKDIHAAWGERYFTVELERDALAAKVQEYEARLKGRVLVPVEYEIENDGTVSAFPTAAIGNAYLYPGNGADEAEALVNLQAAIDEEEHNG